MTAPATAQRRPRRRRPRLLVFGDLVLDIVIRPDEPPTTGTDVRGTISFRAGGSAANSARAFAALGGESAFVGAVGDDALGRLLVRSLRADGVRVHPATVRQPTARLAVLLDARGERSFVTQRGAADALRKRDVSPALVARSDAVHLPAYSLIGDPLRGAAQSAIGLAHDAGRLVSIDLASRRPLLSEGRAAARRMIAGAAPDVIFGNADEARALVGADVRRLLELAPLAVVKEGAAGCQVLWRRGTESAAGEVLQLAVATAPLRARDTTGAGDAFDAGFLHDLLWESLDATPAQSPADRTLHLRRAAVLRRAAMAGHRAAAGLLSRARPELVL